MSLAHSPRITQDGLILCLDAGNTKSYPGSGTVWKDLSGKGHDFTVVSTAFNTDSDGIKNMNFSGGHGIAKRVVSGSLSDILTGTNNATLMCFTKVLNSTTTYRTLVRGASHDHHVIINDPSASVAPNNIGMFNTDGSGQGFKDSTYDIDDFSNFDSKYNCYTFKFQSYLSGAPSAVKWQMSFNNSSFFGGITSTSASFNQGIASIGGHHGGNATNNNANASQFWGNVALVLYYNKHLSTSEIAQNYHAFRGRYGI